MARKPVTKNVRSATRPPDAPGGNRNDKRKARTRARLMGAAVRVMGERGVDAVTIAEIADEADVAFGSFYNHFESKDAIVDAVITDLLEVIGDSIDAATADIDDPLLVLTVAFRMLHRSAEREPGVTSFVLRAVFDDDRLLDAFLSRVRRDVVRAAAAEQIVVVDVDAAVLMLTGASLMATRGVLDGRLPAGEEETIATNLLRLLGVTSAKAAALVRKSGQHLATS